jgi:hypothetical protein
MGIFEEEQEEESQFVARENVFKAVRLLCSSHFQKIQWTNLCVAKSRFS